MRVSRGRSLRSVGRPNHERAHPDGHAVREVRTALEHQVVSPGWFVRDANDSEIQVCLSDIERSPAPDVVQTVLRSRTVADVQIAADMNCVCGVILDRYRGGCEDFAGEWDHDLAAAGGVVTHKVSDSNVTTEREDVGRRSEGPARRLLSTGRSLISFSALGTRWSLLPLAAGPAGPLRI